MNPENPVPGKSTGQASVPAGRLGTLSYRDSGVDIDAQDQALSRIKDLVRSSQLV